MKAKNIFLALGSNIGDRAANLMSALSFLQGHGVEVLTVSSFYETEAIGPKQRSFYNAVLEAKTVLSPLKLLSFTQSVQKAMGRQESARRACRGERPRSPAKAMGCKESARWMPRIIDIDILFFGDMIIKECNLTVPHEMICERLFVLAPLFEIAKDFVHPVLRKSIAEILKEKLPTLKNQKIHLLGDSK